jgi:hypothetical protein
MVGFVLGLLVFYTVNDYLHRPKQTAPQIGTESVSFVTTAITATTATATTATTVPASAAKLAQKISDNPNLQIIDIVFRKWAVNALWDYDTTQVLFYNFADNKFSIPVEVTRRGVEGDYTYFYRSLDTLTRPLVPAPDTPGTIIRFTENEEATRLREEKLRQMWSFR